MAKKKIFVSFDYEKDKQYKFLLSAWSANPNFEFSFSDYSSGEINSSNISVVKAGLTRKINEATHVLVIVGEDANKRHRDSVAIGHKNWQNFEIAQGKASRKKLIAVKINAQYESPDELMNSGASWAMGFTEAAVTKAVNDSN